MVYGGLAAQNGTLSIGSLLVLMAYFAALYSPLETLAYLTEGFASAKAVHVGSWRFSMRKFGH